MALHLACVSLDALPFASVTSHMPPTGIPTGRNGPEFFEDYCDAQQTMSVGCIVGFYFMFTKNRRTSPLETKKLT